MCNMQIYMHNVINSNAPIFVKVACDDLARQSDSSSSLQ